MAGITSVRCSGQGKALEVTAAGARCPDCGSPVGVTPAGKVAAHKRLVFRLS